VHFGKVSHAISYIQLKEVEINSRLRNVRLHKILVFVMPVLGIPVFMQTNVYEIYRCGFDKALLRTLNNLNIFKSDIFYQVGLIFLSELSIITLSTVLDFESCCQDLSFLDKGNSKNLPFPLFWTGIKGEVK